MTKTNIEQSMLTRCVGLMTILVENLQREYAKFPQFGQALNLTDGKSAAISTILYRATKYWSPPGDFRVLHTACAKSTIQLDQELGSFQVDLGDDVLSEHLRRARDLLYSWLAVARPIKQLKYVYICRGNPIIVIPWKKVNTFSYDPRTAKFKASNGETFFSSKGHTSLLEKGLDLKQWNVTEEAAFDAGLLVHSTRFLKLCFKAHYGNLYGSIKKNRDLTVAEIKFCIQYSAWSRGKGEKPKADRIWFPAVPRRVSVGECVTIMRFFKLVSIQLGARFSSVAKDRLKNRGIEPQCWFNVLLQLSFAWTVLRPALKSIGMDLDSQAKQQVRVYEANVTTADFSSASDLNSMYVLEKYIPSPLKDYIKMYRSEFLYDKTTDCWHLLNKVSSMGNGFTFEYMSMWFLAIARVSDPNATVYGDDLVCDSDVWPHLQSIYEGIGLQVNREKTFFDSTYRETCGMFFKESYGAILSFKLEYPSTDADVLVLYNKLFLIEQYSLETGLKGDWLKLISATCSDLSELIPLRCKREFCLNGMPMTYERLSNLPLDQGAFVTFNPADRIRRHALPMEKQKLSFLSKELQIPLRKLYFGKVYGYIEKKSSFIKTTSGRFYHGAGSRVVQERVASYYLFSNRVEGVSIRNRGRVQSRTVVFGDGVVLNWSVYRARYKQHERELLIHLVQFTILWSLLEDTVPNSWHMLENSCV